MARLKIPRTASPELVEAARQRRAVLKRLNEIEVDLRTLGVYDDALKAVPGAAVRELIHDIRKIVA